MAEVILNDGNFQQEVVDSKTVALVDFYASWCGPCQMQSPIIEELAKDFAGQPVKIVKVNVEESPAVAQTYNVMSIPTLLFFKEGKVVEELHGLTPKEFLADKLQQLLS